MTDAVSYLRVSSISQSGNDGFPRQREAIQKFSAANGYNLIAEFSDDGVSGTTELENRPGLAACLERIENNGVKVVIVEGADRLARDYVVFGLIVREFRKVGGTVLSSSGFDLTADDDSNPTAKLVNAVLAAVADFDRCIITAKLKAARERKKQSFNSCEGQKRFGYKSGGPKKPDVPDPNEYPVLQELLAQADLGYSAEDVADILNDKGLKTRSGGRWNPSVVRKIIKRERQSNVVPAKAS